MITRFLIFTYCFMFLTNFLYSQDKGKSAYQIFTANGKKTTYQKLLQKAQKAEVVFFGEIHNNPIAHWLTYELVQDLQKVKKEKLMIGMEMLETDNQIIIDEYLQDWLSTSTFEEEARLWPNYTTDYKPLVEFAKKNKLKVVATNVPRRYASIAFKHTIGKLKMLSKTAQEWIVPLPIEVDLKFYQELFEMAQTGHGTNTDLLHAQAIKDATMAHFILQHWEEDKLFFHLNGLFHSIHGKGIITYLKKQNPDLQIVTIAAISQKEIHTLDKKSKDIADFIICIPESMTKTY